MGRLTLLNAEVISKLVSRFGQRIISEVDGSIDRWELSNIAFSSPIGHRDLTAITFPELYRLSNEHFESAINRGKPVVFDAALIFEWGIEADFDIIVVVNASEDMIIKRAAIKLNISATDIQNRISAQIPTEEKMQRADHVIENDGSLIDLTKKAEVMWKAIK